MTCQRRQAPMKRYFFNILPFILLWQKDTPVHGVGPTQIILWFTCRKGSVHSHSFAHFCWVSQGWNCPPMDPPLRHCIWIFYPTATSVVKSDITQFFFTKLHHSLIIEAHFSCNVSISTYIFKSSISNVTNICKQVKYTSVFQCMVRLALVRCY